jgi:hypothetical protein
MPRCDSTCFSSSSRRRSASWRWRHTSSPSTASCWWLLPGKPAPSCFYALLLADLWAANLTSDLSACGHSTLPSLAACRCRAWEQHSPLAPLFRRYEEELQRAEADRQRLQAESAQLAGLLAAADIERLSGGLPALRSFQRAMHSWLAVAQAFSSATSGKDRGINHSLMPLQGRRCSCQRRRRPSAASTSGSCSRRRRR